MALKPPWPRIVLLYACGLLAAVQLGKFSALAPLLASALVLSLTAVALAISLVEIGGATLGRVGGGLAARFGLVHTLRAGLVALALAGAGEALAPGAAALFAFRLLEAAGYLGVVVSAPLLVVRASAPGGPRTQALAMTLWSTFVPMGLALGAWTSAALAQAAGWRGAIGVWAALAALLALAVWWRIPREAAEAEPPPPPAGAAASTGPVIALALAFGGFAIFQVGLLGLLPSLLVQQAGLLPAEAGRWTAIASVSAVAGSALAAALLRRGLGARGPVGLAMAALGLPPLLLFAVFTPAPVRPWALAAAVAINALGGIFASLAFAWLPRVARGPAALVHANGWITQCGASGSLLGPPPSAAAVQAGGWTAAAVLGLVVSGVTLVLAWRALRP